jgi:hypothetical protein
MGAKFKIATHRADRRRSTLDTATTRDDATEIARTNVERFSARARRDRVASRERGTRRRPRTTDLICRWWRDPKVIVSSAQKSSFSSTTARRAGEFGASRR